MARVPYSEGVPFAQPASQPPRDYQDVQASPADFGGALAQGEQNLGQGANVAVQFFSQIAAQQGANDFTTQANQKLADLKNLRGQDAMTAYPQFLDGLKDLGSDGTQNMPTGDAALEYSRNIRFLSARYEAAARDHYDQQAQTWGIETNQATAANRLQDVAAGAVAGNADAVAKASADLVTARMQEAHVRFGTLTPDIIKNVQEKALADGVTQQVLALAPTNPGRAQQILDANRDHLPGQTYTTLNAHLQTQATASGANDIVNQAMGLPVSGGTGTPKALDPGTQQRAQAVHDEFVKQGVPSDEAWGWAANAVHESDGRTNLTGSDNGTAFGLFQWRGDRLDRYKATHGGHTPDQDDLSTQVAYALEETRTSQYQSRPVIDAAQGPAAKAVAINDAFERPAGGHSEGLNRGATAAVLSGATAPNGPAPPTGALANGVSLASVQQSVPTVAPGNTGLPSYEEAAAKVLAATAGNYKQQQMAMGELNRRYAAQKTAAAAAQAQASDTLMSQMIIDPSKIDPAKDIANNPAFNAVEKEHYFKVWQDQTAARAAGSKDDKTYGPSFPSLLQAVTAPEGDPGRIQDEHVLSGILADHPDQLTVAGFKELRSSLENRKSPEGEAEEALKRQFFQNAKGQITGSSDTQFGGMRDPKGDEQYLRFMASFYSAYTAGKNAGLSPTDMLSPDSKDYLGKMIGGFKRSPAQMHQDQTLANLDPNDQDVQPGTPNPPGFWERNFGGQPRNLDSIMRDVKMGKLSRDDGIAEATRLGLIRPSAPPAAAAPVPASPGVVPTQ